MFDVLTQYIWIQQQIPIWCLLASSYLLDFRYITRMRVELQSLIDQGQNLLTRERQVLSSTILTSNVYDIEQHLDCYSSLIPQSYFLNIHRYGHHFHKTMSIDIQEFLLIVQSLLSSYEFIAQAFKTSLMLAIMLCILSLQFAAEQYEFTSMILCFFVIHIGYVFFSKKRCISILMSQISDSQKYVQDDFWHRVLCHRLCVRKHLASYWYKCSQNLLQVFSDSHPLETHRMFAHTGRQILRESQLRGDLSLFQICGGVLCLICFIVDNFQKFML